jgi:hypothetical protein
LTEVGKGEQIQQMAFSDNTLYGLQAGDVPLARLNPYVPVKLATAWGFTLEKNQPGYEPLLGLDPGQISGFVSPPSSPRNLFISYPGSSCNNILGIEDYEFDSYWTGRNNVSDEQEGVLTDFHYPEAKAPGTFRILLVGNSQVLSGDSLDPGDGTGGEQVMYSPRLFTFAKQLEFLLNARAVLNHVRTHFEVLTLGHPGKTTQLFAYYEAPPLVEKYDIDSVLFFTTPGNVDSEGDYTSYFLKEPTSAGIPAQEIQPEYLLKPVEKRIPPGFAQDLYQRAFAKGFIKRVTPITDSFSPFQDLLESGDGPIRQDLLQMVGLPLKLLSEKIHGHKTSAGKESSFLLCYAPSGDTSPQVKADYCVFWNQLSAQTQLPLLDLDDPFRVLKPAFSPTNDACCHSHYTAYGDILVATLLNYYLVQDKYIPFATATPMPQDSSQ